MATIYYYFNTKLNDTTRAVINDSSIVQFPSQINSNNFIKRGYKCDKWTTNSDGTGTSYYGGETILDNSLTLYGHWIPKIYTISGPDMVAIADAIRIQHGSMQATGKNLLKLEDNYYYAQVAGGETYTLSLYFKNTSIGSTTIDIRQGIETDDPYTTETSVGVKSITIVNKIGITQITTEPRAYSISIDKTSNIDYAQLELGSTATAYEPYTTIPITFPNQFISTIQEIATDTDATASDILKNKIAYANGQKIIGTYDPYVKETIGTFTKNGPFTISTSASSSTTIGTLPSEAYDHIGNIQEITIDDTSVSIANVSISCQPSINIAGEVPYNVQLTARNIDIIVPDGSTLTVLLPYYTLDTH